MLRGTIWWVLLAIGSYLWRVTHNYVACVIHRIPLGDLQIDLVAFEDPFPGSLEPGRSPPLEPARRVSLWEITRQRLLPGVPVFERDPARNLQWLSDQGRRLVSFIENPNAPDCPVLPDTLTYGQLESMSVIRRQSLCSDRLTINSLLSLWDGPRPQIWTRWRVTFANGSGSFHGYTAEGFIIMAYIYRQLGAQVPHISSTSLALYRREHGSTDSLVCIFVYAIVNEQTLSLLSLYGHEGITVDYSTPRYWEILGTRIGRVVSCLVIEAFPRGTVLIARIVVSYEFGTYDLRFDSP
ncbi:hypothetical protein N7478_011316 [Penicillium angulare]|uniref:uncharacterized protein n=1 Tax=Penicillium angulare TaxID=116970 RepID=UPI002541EB49|nr:uncharacterized protein N7478_011316 [Penicillium angulare]KAJ5263711.1 hypothetical protein N7478_011316 [Penicillium angulare]